MASYGYEGSLANQLEGDLPMSGDEVREWFARIERDKRRRDNEDNRWQQLFKGYMPPAWSVGDWSQAAVNSNVHFRNAELKKAEVWAQLPELRLIPLEPLSDVLTVSDPNNPQQPPQPRLNPLTNKPITVDEIVAVKKAVLNKLLGREHANVDQTMEEALFDVFATSGVGFTKICYQADVQYPPEQPEESTQPGNILNLGTPPNSQSLGPVVVNERWRWYRFSAKKGIIPADFYSTNYDEAPYLGMEFIEVLTPAAIRAYNLPKDFKPNVSRDELIISKGLESYAGNASAKIQLFKGVEVWLYACYFDPTVANTQVMRRLVLIEGMKDKPAIYRNSPYQTIGPDGRLSTDSMIGNPIHPICLRVASDTAWVPSDAAFTDPLVRVENTWLAQDVKMRDANLPRFLHSDKITPAMDKLKNLDTGQGSAVPHELMMLGTERLIAPLPKLEHAASDAEGRAQNQRAIAETLGIGANQAGAPTTTVRSATENAIIAQNVSVRLKKEQNRCLQRFLQGVRKFDSLVQRYMTDPGYITIVGTHGNQQLMPFTQAHLSGRYAYDAFVDTQLTTDLNVLIQRFVTFVNFFAKSGYLNMPETVREGTELFGFDPSRMIHDPEPPPPPPPPPVGLTLSLKAVDLVLPEVKVILAQRGINLEQQVSPEMTAAIAQAQAEAHHGLGPHAGNGHGGGATKVDLIEKHSAEESHRQPGHPPVAPAQPQPVTPGITPPRVQ